ncbi:MAG: hypothetical protein F6K31_37880 [Symploca sp. SIO2G7]|nr:hypothetical protein [Symploca sp. SIO2G7]
MLKQSNLITVACCLLPVASFHQPIFNLVQDLSVREFSTKVQGWVSLSIQFPCTYIKESRKRWRC